MFLMSMVGLGILLAVFVVFGPTGADTGDGGGSGEDLFKCRSGDDGGDGGGD